MKLGIICTMINGFGRRGFYNTQEIGLGRELVRQGHAVTIYKCVKKEGAGEAERVELGDRLSILYIPVSSFGAHGCLDRISAYIYLSFFGDCRAVPQQRLP